MAAQRQRIQTEFIETEKGSVLSVIYGEDTPFYDCFYSPRAYPTRSLVVFSRLFTWVRSTAWLQ